MTIFQKPNRLLIIAIIGFAISRITGGSAHLIASTVFTMAIIIWAYEEATQGVNVFRKLLGATVLVIIGVSLFGQLR